MEVARRGGVFWLKWKYFPFSVLSYFYRYSVDSKIFLKDEALKKKGIYSVKSLAVCFCCVVQLCDVLIIFHFIFQHCQ